jgi:hypothetical protein
VRRLAVSVLVLAAAGCGGGSGGSTYHATPTANCLDEQQGVVVIPTPGSQLGQFPGATDVLDISFSLAHQTPPPQAIVMFARSAADERHMEQSLEQLVQTAFHMSMRRRLYRSRNVAWMWIGPHAAAQDRAVRGCLS